MTWGEGGIAVIGWGSLIWDLDDLAPKVTGDWLRRAGPILPLEFCRISPKRLRALALIVDPDIGEPFPSSVIRSRRPDLSEAVADLAARERAPLERIGYVGPTERRCSRPEIAERVAAWCAEAGWSGAVWTDLPANFAAETGAPFTVEAACAYLRTLQGDALAEAKRYIDSAPEEVATPLRRSLADDPWWRGLTPA